MLHYIDHNISVVPYVRNIREELGLDSNHCALSLFDVFAVHRYKSVLQSLETNKIRCSFVPANCTGELQPLNVTVNQVFKQELK